MHAAGSASKPEMHQIGGRDRHRRLPQHPGSARGSRACCAAPSSAWRARTDCAWAPPAPIPSRDWRKQEIYPDERYYTIVEDMKMVARANLIFGLHVHIGVEDRETAIQLMNAARYFLPHMLALSANSPFWLGMDTGLQILSLQGVRQVSAHQHSRIIFRAGASIESYVDLLMQDQLHRQRQENLVGHPPASAFSDARIPLLRYAHAAG